MKKNKQYINFRRYVYLILYNEVAFILNYKIKSGSKYNKVIVDGFEADLPYTISVLAKPESNNKVKKNRK